MNKKDIDDKSWEIMTKFTYEMFLLIAILSVPLFFMIVFASIGICLI